MNNGSEPAHPISSSDEEDQSCSSWGKKGLTKREYFAAQALIGLLSGQPYESRFMRDHAKEAVVLADALLEALEAPEAGRNGGHNN